MSPASQSDPPSSSTTKTRFPNSPFSLAQSRILPSPGDTEPRQKIVQGVCSTIPAMVDKSPSSPSQTTTTKAGVLPRCPDNSTTASSAIAAEQQRNMLSSPNQVFICFLLSRSSHNRVGRAKCLSQCSVHSTRYSVLSTQIPAGREELAHATAILGQAADVLNHRRLVCPTFHAKLTFHRFLPTIAVFHRANVLQPLHTTAPNFTPLKGESMSACLVPLSGHPCKTRSSSGSIFLPLCADRNEPRSMGHPSGFSSLGNRLARRPSFRTWFGRSDPRATAV